MFHLWSSENQIVGVGSRSGRTKPITKHGNVHCDWFVLLLLLPTLTIWFSLDHKQNASNGVVSGVGRNGNVLILLTLIPSCLWLQFLIFTRSQALLGFRLRLWLRLRRQWKPAFSISQFQLGPTSPSPNASPQAKLTPGH